ncbi:hypothetical protein K2173_021991 [Erythroxylum novogranatense]|uniref:Peptidase metallopeptidase domain-containing protein n=1 Tax=Erythroxylum novogranatense TaxID=1862640 RepID=A0AAV8T3W7_9ROSI|nr:hypothetical protein K2173_021991 [Erythroxylum novogranatense]
MRPTVFLVAVSLLSLHLCLPVSARFFPNVSSIPHNLLLPNVKNTAWDSFRKFSGCHFGERFAGLTKLKQYFYYFGYIPDKVANFTDNFDDQLQSALRTYQQNFNLNVTGQLDEATVEQLIRPRCGNADIVNGSTSMNSGKAKATSNGLRTVSHYSFFPGTPRWRKQNLTYTFWPNNQLGDDTKSVFSRAFQRWAEVIPLNFTESGVYQSADIRIGFFRGDHGDGEPFDGVLGTLAHAFSPPSGWFHLDLDENWVISGDVTASVISSAVDLESVVVHEIGHLLGLGHSSDEEAIMYPTISASSRKVDLRNDDVLGIQQLYGTNPNYNTMLSPSVQQNDTSGTGCVDSRWAINVLVAGGLVLMLL